MISIGFALRALSGGGLPWFVGHECRAGLINLALELDPELGPALHGGVEAGSRRKAAFSLKPLRFVSGFNVVFPEKSPRSFPVEGNVAFEPEARAFMKVVFLRDDVANKFLWALFSKMSGLRINIKGYEFEVERIEFEMIDPHEVIRSGEPLEEVDVEFLTPTYFNPIRGDAEYKVLYPDTALMLASLISTARQLTNASYPRPEELARLVYISGLDIKTSKIKEMKHKAPTGFVGWIKLRMKEGISEEAKKTISGLLRLGEITNIGGNRSGGYGVIELKAAKGKTR